VSNSSPSEFDPFQKEKALREESSRWDTSRPGPAEEGDIPVIDLQEYLSTGSTSALTKAADTLRIACEQTGFFAITGHQVSEHRVGEMFDMVRAFHALPDAIKRSRLMDGPDQHVGGVGYLPLKNRKLPARDTANVNEAYIVKVDDKLGLDDNPWPPADALPGFRSTVQDYARTMEDLGKKLLPIFAAALGVPADFFDDAFDKPLYRLRMTHYPPVPPEQSEQFGISPHVDTTFCTILAQDQPGLTIYSERRKVWIRAPLLDDAFIVNTGELLRQWSNDRFLSVKHFANNNTSGLSRYSIPFFFNANPHFRMHCIPGCSGPDNPPKYPPISYAESQATVQGE